MKVHLIGGDMVAGSDLDGRHGPGPVRGQVLAPLLASARGRVLIAGPHDPLLIDPLLIDDLTLLVRTVPDADALADRYADRPGVAVYCGAVEKLVAVPPYDTVVALDGLARLSSAEGAEPTWAEALQTLFDVLRPGGRLLLGMENFLGLHRMVALRPRLGDMEWVVAGEHDPTRPAGLPQVRACLQAAGLDVARTYAGYPAPTAPTVLFDTDALAGAGPHGLAEATVGRACASPVPVLTDPVRLATDAVRHALGAELAPGWIVVAHRGPAGAQPALQSLPEALVVTEETRVDLHRGPGDGWTRRSDGAAIGVVPRGRTLQDLLLGACLRRDLPAVRELLGSWQAGMVAGVPADQVIVGPDGSLTALTVPGEPAVALLEFAATLIDGGYEHPWPGRPDAADLAVTLAAAIGRDGDAALPAAEALPWRARPDAGAFRELAAERDRLAGELADARAKALWYEEMLTSRDDALKRAQRVVALLSGTPSARAGRIVVGGIRVVRRAGRAALRRIRPLS